MNLVLKKFEQNNIYVLKLECSQIAYHTKYIQSSGDNLMKELKKYITEPKLRSKKWISTAILDEDKVDSSLRYCSAEYWKHNLVNSVRFYDRLNQLPLNAIVVELSPHMIFKKVIDETLNECSYLAPLRKNSNDNLANFLYMLSELYPLGLNPNIEVLYPKVEWPVPRGTQSIGSLIKWDHSKSFTKRIYPEFYNRDTASDYNARIDLNDMLFIKDHCVDGKVFFPATGFLMLAWRRMACSYGRVWDQLTVLFKNVSFKRAVMIKNSTKLAVKYIKNTGISRYNFNLIFKFIKLY